MDQEMKYRFGERNNDCIIIKSSELLFSSKYYLVRSSFKFNLASYQNRIFNIFIYL